VDSNALKECSGSSVEISTVRCVLYLALGASDIACLLASIHSTVFHIDSQMLLRKMLS